MGSIFFSLFLYCAAARFSFSLCAVCVLNYIRLFYLNFLPLCTYVRAYVRTLTGYAAYELSKSLSQLAKNQLAAKCGKAEYAALMAEALHHLETATEIMAFDPKDTFYGALAMTANKELKEMQKTFAELN